MADASSEHGEVEARAVLRPVVTAIFDSEFYRRVLPERVKRECDGQPDSVAVVNFHLADGRTLDVCHLAHLDDAWMVIVYYRDIRACEDMDVAFVPYGMVTLITIALHPSSNRRLGFHVPPFEKGQEQHSGVDQQTG